jgi:hypothetical protein
VEPVFVHCPGKIGVAGRKLEMSGASFSGRCSFGSSSLFLCPPRKILVISFHCSPCSLARAVALMTYVAAGRLVLNTMILLHLALHFTADFLTALVFAFMQALLMLGMLCQGVLRVIDRSSRGCLGRCEGSGCEKGVHFDTPKHQSGTRSMRTN